MSGDLLRVRGLTTTVQTDSGSFDAVRGVNIDVNPGEIVGLVGESGSGKSLTARSIIGLLPGRRVKISGGSVCYRGQELVGLSEKQLARLRGSEIAMIFQDPQSYLNPVMPVGDQIAESIHEDVTRGEKMARVEELLSLAGIPPGRRISEQYPHQLSGGMNQRVLIAMALAGSPRLLLADEPTTALDVTIQAQILALLRRLSAELGMSVLMISHDLGVISEMCDRVYVMYAGNIVESTDVRSLFSGRARHPYTMGLLDSIKFLNDPDAELTSIPGSAADPADPPQGCRFHPRCPHAVEHCRVEEPILRGDDGFVPGQLVACHLATNLQIVAAPADADESIVATPTTPTAWPAEPSGPPLLEMVGLHRYFELPAQPGRKQARVQAVVDVNLSLRKGSSLALVGESGSGKTTIARMVMKLLDPSEGEVRFNGVALSEMGRHTVREYRRRVQIVFQDPYASLNPTRTVERILTQPYTTHRICSHKEALGRAEELLHQVGLDTRYLERYPHQLSGGERQRVAFARAIALDPELVVADEPVSALDMSIRSQVLDLMKKERVENGRSYVLITHDLANAATLTDQIAVLYLGRTVEVGNTRQVLESPLHPYTAALIASTPVPDAEVARRARGPVVEGEIPSPVDPPSGCVFSTRCAYAVPGKCDTERPPLRQIAPDRLAACHFSEQWLDGGVPEPLTVELPSRRQTSDVATSRTD